MVLKKSPLKFYGRSVSHLACLKGQQSKQTLGFFLKIYIIKLYKKNYFHSIIFETYSSVVHHDQILFLWVPGQYPCLTM